ncbi:MAG TPA: methionyl-tRNA formyltransferase [Candidatus Aveggerthella stercoripullorum]|uniref:Methionyl-tRNA formyltransferase n=1 Tax=Candidatus Aveggerthella stercoripullorum TaxID=2840688 RepID=A0A9D1D501_9ACTN|nr:methionyl-tRNA formyltransferase [Candidatus Aveggerthella stercoripullorum]
MRVVFMGTPDFAATILEELANHHEVLAVYTRPDAVRGRGKALVASPVKAMAERCGLEVRTPRTLRDAEVQRELRELRPDVICVAAYGALLPKEVLDIPPFGCVNVHASLLPRWRGAAPVERAILAGDRETGVCVMRMEEGLDTGAYCVCRSVEIGELGAVQLTDELSNLGAHALLTALAHLEAGEAEWVEQDESLVTYAHKIEKHELFLDPSEGAVTNARRVQASSKAHAARCGIAGKSVTVLDACAAAREGECADLPSVEPGFVSFFQKRLYLGCTDGLLELFEVQPDGKQPMDARAFAAGLQNVKSGTLEWSRLDG